MNRRTFTYIMVLMGLSIAGIILVQIIWINNAIGVKTDLFDRSVNEAMNRAVQHLEDRQNFRIFTQFDDSDSAVWVQQGIKPPPPRQIRMIRDRKFPTNTQFEIVTDSAGTQTHTFTFSGEGGQKVRTETIVVNAKDTVLIDTDQFIRDNQRKLDSLNVVLDTLRVISPGLHKRIEMKTQNLQNFNHRVMNEVTELEHEEIPLPELTRVVKRELIDRDIPIDFELALSENDSLIQLSPNADSLALAESSYVVRLFPHAIFNRNSKLHLYFPNQGRFIYKSVSWLLAASLIFSLIILLTFTLSILFMLKQKKISEMKTDFINNMTHEFKTPIATISVAADSIVNDKVIHQPDRVNYYVEMIKKENLRMNRQVEDILTIARLDKKEFEFTWEAVNIHQLIEEVSESVRLQVDKRGGELLIRTEAINPIVTSDRVHCANLIYNLLDNANKYSSDKPQIEITTRNTAKGVVIAVSDKGIGMSKPVQSKIFERFYRQTSGNIHNVKGFGLGLSYVKAVVEANKGIIHVSSELGKGSRFDVFLPFVMETN
ncbi:sensor histidine kinase [Mangrovibacterium lignilyticum]|uniref:sensor histidine kinase n=1 Tax=Mangrovibacterium lignilyticum TaxID=2668052 RepID=UPI0013D408AB|nr:HAMP domain-containing sensor histidine kinase [Mangrovibacterium lignilyticum]